MRVIQIGSDKVDHMWISRHYRVISGSGDNCLLEAHRSYNDILLESLAFQHTCRNFMHKTSHVINVLAANDEIILNIACFEDNSV